jgi:predicted transcriptional regulator
MKKTVKIDADLHRRLAVVARLCDQTIEEFAEAGIKKEVSLVEHHRIEQARKK